MVWHTAPKDLGVALIVWSQVLEMVRDIFSTSVQVYGLLTTSTASLNKLDFPPLQFGYQGRRNFASTVS